MGAWGTEMPLQDLIGYTKMDVTVAAGPPAPPRSEERNEAAACAIGSAGAEQSTAGSAICR